MLLWCIGVPATLYGILFRARKRLHESTAVASLGFLFAGFKPSLPFWEVSIMVRKLAVVAVVSLVNDAQLRFVRLILCLGVVLLALMFQVRCSHRPFCQWAAAPALWFAGVCSHTFQGKRPRGVAGWAQVGWKPYKHSVLNNMEAVSLIATSVTMYLASFFTVDNSFSRGFLATVGMALIVGNALVMAWFVVNIVHAGTKTVLKRIGAMEAHEDEARSALPVPVVLLEWQHNSQTRGSVRCVQVRLTHIQQAPIQAWRSASAAGKRSIHLLRTQSNSSPLANKGGMLGSFRRLGSKRTESLPDDAVEEAPAVPGGVPTLASLVEVQSHRTSGATGDAVGSAAAPHPILPLQTVPEVPEEERHAFLSGGEASAPSPAQRPTGLHRAEAVAAPSSCQRQTGPEQPPSQALLRLDCTQSGFTGMFEAPGVQEWVKRESLVFSAVAPVQDDSPSPPAGRKRTRQNR